MEFVDKNMSDAFLFIRHIYLFMNLSFICWILFENIITCFSNNKFWIKEIEVKRKIQILKIKQNIHKILNKSK